MNDQPANQPFPFPVLRTAGWLIGLAAVVAGLVSALLASFGFGEHLSLNLIAAAVCLGAGLLALLPVFVLSRRSFMSGAYGFLVGILIRMAVCGLFIVLIKGSDLDATGKLSFWVAGWYLVLLFIEVMLMSCYIRSFNRHFAEMSGVPAELLSVATDAENTL